MMNNSIKIWLIASAFMCILMVFIGGVTRLSNAGLSIVEWKPVTGLLPPLSNYAWEEEFSKYQKSPEYRIINTHMTLSEFKKIFLIEFIHRIAARLTGVIICIPLMFFYFSGRLPFAQNKSYLLIPLLLLAQGFMGWYMVKSGLKFKPYVSHFRLTAHLMLAVALYSIILWKLYQGKFRPSALGITALSVVYIQIFLGGLVAGLDAGLIYNTFPLMGESFVPEEYLALNVIDIIYDPASVQFLHRSMAYVVLICTIAFAYTIKNMAAIFIVSAVLMQVITGVMTLVLVVPFSLALIHQFFAMILLTSIIYALTV
jgi:cytochrome c oxidase assembly protein subunit 15